MKKEDEKDRRQKGKCVREGGEGGREEGGEMIKNSNNN